MGIFDWLFGENEETTNKKAWQKTSEATKRSKEGI